MRSVLLTRIALLLGGALVLASVPFAGAAAGTGSGAPIRARITGAPIHGTSATLSSGPAAAPSGLPSRRTRSGC